MISKKPGVCGGRPCIDGTRIEVNLILALKKRNLTDEQILELYPHLNQNQLDSVYEYAKVSVLRKKQK